MLGHLVKPIPGIDTLDNLQDEFEPVKRVSPEKLQRSQQVTAKWLEELGAPDDDEVTAHQQREQARDAFLAVATAQPDEAQRAGLLRIKSPSALKHLGAMLEAHDWEFVERAKELRSYAVTKILAETEHHDARIRLRALELLGKVTEIGLFTERVEVKKVEVGDRELEQKIREKLERVMMSSGQLEDVTVKPPAEELKPIELGAPDVQQDNSEAGA